MTTEIAINFDGGQLPENPSDFRQARPYVPQTSSDVYAWSLSRVRGARNAQMAGDFTISAPLGQAMKTDPAIFAALLNRIAPHRGLQREVYGGTAPVRALAADVFGLHSPYLSTATIADQLESIVQHGIGVSQNTWTPRDDGSAIDVHVRPWPMRAVRWDPNRCQLLAQTTAGLKPIVHGDGQWTVWALHGSKPWQWGAVKSASLAWADRAFGIRDRSQHAEAQGMAKFIGELPEGVAIKDDIGQSFIAMLKGLRASDAGGVYPHNAKVQLLESTSGQGWQIFKELISSDTTDITRVYLGQDGTMSNEGGNYIKAAQLGAVRNDLVEGDLAAAAHAINTGILRPWSMLNYGRDDVRMHWLFPDPDEDARRESLAKRTDAFNKAIAEFAANGFEITQAYATDLARQFGVTAPKLSSVPQKEINDE